MIDRDQKIKITHNPAATSRKAPQFRADIMARALSVKKKRATPWMMLTSVSSMFITVESSSRRLSLGGFTVATGNRSATGMSSRGRGFICNRSNDSDRRLQLYLGVQQGVRSRSVRAKTLT